MGLALDTHEFFLDELGDKCYKEIGFCLYLLISAKDTDLPVIQAPQYIFLYVTVKVLSIVSRTITLLHLRNNCVTINLCGHIAKMHPTPAETHNHVSVAC